jgi:hypothetical protein
MDAIPASSMSKVFAKEIAERVSSRAAQILGVRGYRRDWMLEKDYRGIRALQIHGGTNQIQRILVSSMSHAPVRTRGLR